MCWGYRGLSLEERQSRCRLARTILSTRSLKTKYYAPRRPRGALSPLRFSFRKHMSEKASAKLCRLIFAALVAASLIFHISILWESRHKIAAGYGDFIIFYTGAQIIADGKSRELFKVGTQNAYQAKFDVPQLEWPLPFNHARFELFLFPTLGSFLVSRSACDMVRSKCSTLSSHVVLALVVCLLAVRLFYWSFCLCMVPDHGGVSTRSGFDFVRGAFARRFRCPEAKTGGVGRLSFWLLAFINHSLCCRWPAS